MKTTEITSLETEIAGMSAGGAKTAKEDELTAAKSAKALLVTAKTAAEATY